MNDPHDPNLPPPSGSLNQEQAAPDERLRAERRRQLLRIGTAVPMVLTLRPGSTLAASGECAPDEGAEGGSTACAASTALREGERSDVSDRPTLLAGRTGSSYAKYWLDQA